MPTYTNWEDFDDARDQLEGRDFSTSKLHAPRHPERPIGAPQRREFDFTRSSVRWVKGKRV